MAAHRAQTRARTSDIAAQEHEVGNLADHRHRMAVLRDPHRPCGDDAIRGQIDLCRLCDLVAAEAGLVFDLVPGGGVHRVAVGLERLGVRAQEGVIQHCGLAGGLCSLLGGENDFGHAAKHCHVAAKARAVIVGRGCFGAAADHFQLVLRVGKTVQALFLKGVEHHHPCAALGGGAQIGKHARVVGAGVLTNHKDRIGLLEILQKHGAFADADGLGEGNPAGLVAHIGAIGEVVGAIKAHEHLIKKRRLVAGATGGVELRPVGIIQRIEARGDPGKSVVPRDLDIAVAVGIIAHGVGQAALFFQCVV